MSEAEVFLQQFEGELLRQAEYLIKQPFHSVSKKNRKGEHSTQFQITKSLLLRLEYFLENGGRELLSQSKIRNFVDKVAEAISVYPASVSGYLADVENDWSRVADEFDDEDEVDISHIKNKELEFQSDLMGNSVKVKTDLAVLNINNNVDNLIIPIEGDKVLPFIMRRRLIEIFPMIETYMNEHKGDLTHAEAPNKGVMFISIPKDKIPYYDPSKHFYEQTADVLQFFEEEEYKIKNGITIDGVFIHPWLYFHLNFFKTPIPQADGSEPITHPTFRDNEWYFAHNLNRLNDPNEEGKGIGIWGSRRYAKSSMITSYAFWKALTKENSQASVVGGDDQDINTMANYLKVAIAYIHPAFKPAFNKMDYSKEVILGLKHKTGGEPIEHSRIKTVNVQGGAATEKTAGASPSCFIMDEFGKFKAKAPYQAAIPSFQTPTGWKCNPMLVGTGGNEELSQDARDIVYNPKGYKLINMDWDFLEKQIEDKSLITWKQKDYVCFVPAQMSYKDGIVKDVSNLADYLKIDSEVLSGIEMHVTNWKTSLDVILKDRKELEGDKEALNKERMYYPIDPDEPFLLNTDNPFPAARAQMLIDELKDRGEMGKPVEVYLKTNGTLGYILSDKEVVTEFPYRGGTHDAPVLMFCDPPLDKIPPYGLNVSGLDPYNQAEATTSSLGAFYILRREGIIGDKFGGKILASYVSRPEIPDNFDNTIKELIIGYNAECLMENADTGFIRFMERANKAHYLAEGIDLAKTINPKTRQATNIGLYPTEKNKKHLINRVIQYCNEKIVVGVDPETLTPIEDYGIVRINDIYLLDEIKQFAHGKNVDRIVAFGHALCWMEWQDEMAVPIETTEMKEKKTENRKKKINHYRGFYTSKRRGFHNKG